MKLKSLTFLLSMLLSTRRFSTNTQFWHSQNKYLEFGNSIEFSELSEAYTQFFLCPFLGICKSWLRQRWQ